MGCIVNSCYGIPNRGYITASKEKRLLIEYLLVHLAPNIGVQCTVRLWKYPFLKLIFLFIFLFYYLNAVSWCYLLLLLSHLFTSHTTFPTLSNWHNWLNKQSLNFAPSFPKLLYFHSISLWSFWLSPRYRGHFSQVRNAHQCVHGTSRLVTY